MSMRRDKEKMRDEAVLIGASGGSYRHGKGPFYPTDLPAERYLPFYAGRFPTGEINSTFSRLPEERTLARWAGWKKGPAPGAPGSWSHPPPGTPTERNAVGFLLPAAVAEAW